MRMRAYTIYVGEQRLGIEFGNSEQDALERYAEGSIYPIEQLRAVRGVSHEAQEPQ